MWRQAVRRILAAGLVLVLPLLAAAQTAPEPKLVRPGVAGVCTDQHHAAIDSAYAEAARHVRTALAQLAAGEAQAEFRRWFGTAPVKPVEERLRRILAALEAGRPYDTACEQPRSCQGSVAAYAQPRTGAMGFCARFFRMPDTGLDSRFGTVVHEVSHLVADTEDIAYGPRRAEALARENPGLALRNADNYQYFVESLAR